MKQFKKMTLWSVALVLVIVTNSHAAPAQYQCYNFDDLVAGKEYTVGDVIDTEHATITIKPYFTNGTPATATVRHAESAPANIAGGTAPELSLYLVSLNVVPHQPVTRIKTLLAQNISQTGDFADANIEVNGEKHESPRGFAQMNGKSIGKPGKGRAKIRATVLPTSANWHAGTLEVRAKLGEAIESFTLGGHTWRVDDMCFGL